MVKVMWAIIIVKNPVLNFSATNVKPKALPIMISGITIGAYVMPEKSVFPLNRRNFTKAKEDIVPRITANVEVLNASKRLVLVADQIPSCSKRSVYHFVEKPLQTVTSFDSLKL